MSGLEIVLLVVGLVFILVSLFLVDRGQDKESKKVSLEAEAVFPEDEMEKVIQEIRKKIDVLVSDCVYNTEDQLSHLTNEKIMAVNDFSEQLITKLENNHQEVIFLYNMLQEKEAEMKSTLNRMEVVRKENNEFLNRLLELRNAKTKAVPKPQSVSEVPAGKQAMKNDEKRESVADKNIKLEMTKVEKTQTAASVADPDMILADKDSQNNKNEKILQLYKQKKTVREISRTLSLGQGEVKLVIDLYGK